MTVRSSLLCARGEQGARVPEGTPVGVYVFCRTRSRTRSRSSGEIFSFYQSEIIAFIKLKFDLIG